MFDLEKYKTNNHFFFTKENQLNKVCNAPTTGLGVYLVYALKNGRIELVYIGSSGKVTQNGEPQPRKGGLYDRIVNGKQFGRSRRLSWKDILIKEDIEALDIYWYETFNQEHHDIPSMVEHLILQQHFEIFGRLPRWNKAI